MKPIFYQELLKLRIKASSLISLVSVISMMFLTALTTMHSSITDGKFYFISAYGGFQWFMVALIAISASSVTSEFQFGTIKHLIIQEDRRWKVYYVKLLVALLYDVIGHLVVIMTAVVIKSILYPELRLSDNYLHGDTLFMNLLLNSVFDLFVSLLFIGLVFLIASVSVNSSLSITVGLGTAFVGEGFSNMILSSFQQLVPIFKWNPFNMLNLQQQFAYPIHINDTHLTLSCMFIGLIIWTCILLFIGQILFQRRKI